MKTYIFVPPLRKMTGGIAVLYQLADYIHSGGYETYLAYREQPPEITSCSVPVCPWEELSLSQEDIWLVPEGWVNALAPGLQAKARNWVYVQNWAYLLSALPEGVSWNQLDVSFLNVSAPVAWYTEYVTGKKGPILRPTIDPVHFHPPAKKPQGTIRIAWMPRKNRAIARQIRETFTARMSLSPSSPHIEWIEIHGKTPQEVAELLRGAHIFLATGFPEGFGLPPLEAMACGCIVVGFSGMGSWDYMEQAIPEGITPWWESAQPCSGKNAFVLADADVPATAMQLEKIVQYHEQQAPELDVIRKNAQETVSRYTKDVRRKEVLTLWQQLATPPAYK